MAIVCPVHPQAWGRGGRGAWRHVNVITPDDIVKGRRIIGNGVVTSVMEIAAAVHTSRRGGGGAALVAVERWGGRHVMCLAHGLVYVVSEGEEGGNNEEWSTWGGKNVVSLLSLRLNS